MRLAIATIARNEGAFIRSWVREARALADEVWVGDNGSTDGTAAAAREEGAHVIEIPFRDLLEHGFGWVRNQLLGEIPSPVDRVHWLDADERVAPAQKRFLRVERGEAPALVHTRTFTEKRQGFHIESWKNFTRGLHVEDLHTRSHPRVVRTGAEFVWRGYIHEELYRGEDAAHRLRVPSPVIHWHFSVERPRLDPWPKHLLYGFMIDRAVRVPALQRGTNAWWYTVRAPQMPHAEQAAAFRQLCPETKGL